MCGCTCHACVRARVHACMGAHVNACMGARVHACMGVCVCAYMCGCMWKPKDNTGSLLGGHLLFVLGCGFVLGTGVSPRPRTHQVGQEDWPATLGPCHRSPLPQC